MPKKIELGLGVKVSDALTGFTGTITMKTTKMDGNVQWCVQPPCKKDGTEPDGRFIDGHLLKVIGAGVSASVIPLDDAVSAKLGEQYEDIVTKVKGIAIERVDHMNGCVYFTIQPEIGTVPKGRDNQMPKAIYIQHARLKRLGAGISKTAAVRVASNEAPGGASRSIRDVIG